MYIGAASFVSLVASPAAPSSSSPASDLNLVNATPDLLEILRAFVLRVVDVLRTWFLCWGPSLAWIPQAIGASYSFVQHNPHPFHILGWSIFFGPIIILIPCLLFVELVIILLFHLGGLFHGQTRETIPDRFELLKDYFIDARETLFATVEHWTATFNKWTVAHPALLVLRLAGAALGVVVLVGIWGGW